MSASVNQMLAHWLTVCADQGVFTTDRELRVTSWNDWLERHSGRSATAVVGRPLMELYPELAERHLDLLYRDAIGGHGSVVSTALHRYLLPLQPLLRQQPKKPRSNTGNIVMQPAIADHGMAGFSFSSPCHRYA